MLGQWGPLSSTILQMWAKAHRCHVTCIAASRWQKWDKPRPQSARQPPALIPSLLYPHLPPQFYFILQNSVKNVNSNDKWSWVLNFATVPGRWHARLQAGITQSAPRPLTHVHCRGPLTAPNCMSTNCTSHRWVIFGELPLRKVWIL